MPKLETYLFFDGNCAQAMRFYEKTLGGKFATLMTGKESPVADKLPPGSGDKILHARLDFDGGTLMASDWMAEEPYPGMSGFAVSVAYTKVDEAQRLFDALAKGGKVTMPFGKTFWAEAFGMLEDRFGTSWMIGGGGAAA